MFLAVVMVVPTFAMEIIPKVGYLFSPGLHFKKISYNKASSFSAGADFMFQMGKTGLYIGPGFTWNHEHKIIDFSNSKFCSTNIFATTKYKFKAGGDVNLYPFLQVGLGVCNIDSFKIIDLTREFWSCGIYYGLGFGAEYKNIIFELLYSWNKGEFTDKNFGQNYFFSVTKNFTYSAFRIQVGYKFSL